MEGLGYSNAYTKGILVHSSLAMTVEGLPLGILAQSTATRPEPKDGSMTAYEKSQLPIEEKESYKWIESMRIAQGFIPEGTDAVHVCDREADIYEFFHEAQEINAKVVVRASHNRILDNEEEKLFGHARAMPPCGAVAAQIPRDTRKGQKAREAELETSCGEVALSKPSNRSEAHLPASIKASAVYVVEKNPPEGNEPVEWLLLSTEPAGSFESAVETLGYYVQRWKIERYHYVLKQGCSVEKVQERSASRQTSMVFLCSMVAVYIMGLTYLGRITPDMECSGVFSEEEWKILFCAANKINEPPAKPCSMRDAAKYIAKLGGISGSPSDGEPGVKAIWEGLGVLWNLTEYWMFMPKV